MKLFNKERKTREIKDDDSLFVKLWFNPRSHAAIVLGLYFLFFAIIIIIINVSGTKGPKDNSVDGSSINDLFTKLSDKNISYNYVITMQNKKYYFSGVDKEDEIFGTILYNGESQSIKVHDSDCAVGKYNDKGEFVPAYSLCPENINYNYFNYDYIYELIKNTKGSKYETDKYYLFNLKDNLVVKVYYDNNSLKVITVEDNKSTYLLEFMTEDTLETNNESENIDTDLKK